MVCFKYIQNTLYLGENMGDDDYYDDDDDNYDDDDDDDDDHNDYDDDGTPFVVKETWLPLISDGSGHGTLGTFGLPSSTYLIQTCL
jgi:hypothetical protein